MANSALAFCPFCGGVADFLDEEMDRNAKGEVTITWTVECTKCGAMLGYRRGRTKEEAAVEWNQRA